MSGFVDEIVFAYFSFLCNFKCILYIGALLRSTSYFADDPSLLDALRKQYPITLNVSLSHFIVKNKKASVYITHSTSF